MFFHNRSWIKQVKNSTGLKVCTNTTGTRKKYDKIESFQLIEKLKFPALPLMHFTTIPFYRFFVVWLKTSHSPYFARHVA